MDLLNIIEQGNSIEFWFRFPPDDLTRKVVLDAALQERLQQLNAWRPEGSVSIFVPYWDAAEQYRVVLITMDLNFAPRRIVPLAIITPTIGQNSPEDSPGVELSYFCPQCEIPRNIMLTSSQQAEVNAFFESQAVDPAFPNLLPEFTYLDPHVDSHGNPHIVELDVRPDFTVKVFLRNSAFAEPEIVN